MSAPLSRAARDRQRQRAGLTALGWTLVFWVPASIAVAVAVSTREPGASYAGTIGRFIVDESSASSCFVIAAIASAIGYPVAQQRCPVLRPGFLESQYFAATVFGAMLLVAIPLRYLLEQVAGVHLALAAAAAIFVPLKLGFATIAALTVYPWWSAGHERRLSGREDG